MARQYTIGIVSDIHYASAAEKARGDDCGFAGITSPFQLMLARFYRHFLWLRHPMGQNHLLDEFLQRMDSPDYVVANGDYSCNSAFVGVSDDAACRSARECLEKLRIKFGANFQATFGDHELGKLSFMGGQGGMRLASWHRARSELGLQPFWQVELGNYVLIGVASSLLALPVYEPDALATELAGWHELRAQHFADIRRAFAELKPGQRVLLFCHDPTALPFLWHDETVRNKLPQVEQTVIGHLHSNLVFWKGRLLAGMPMIPFLGHTTKRLSAALREARHWRPFNVRLCPSLAGIELLKDGGFYTAELDADARQRARFQFHRIAR
jgi:calcineurin-like phosphoesterase family protein